MTRIINPERPDRMSATIFSPVMGRIFVNICPLPAKPRYNYCFRVHGRIITMFVINGFIGVLALVFSGWALYKGLESKKEYTRLKSEMLNPPNQDE